MRYLVRRRIDAGEVVLPIGTVLEEEDVAGWVNLQSLINIGHLEAVPDLPARPSAPPPPRRKPRALDVHLDMPVA